MKEPNRSDFSKTSFMIGFRMPFNSRYQPLYHVASYTSLLQGWNTDPFPEVFVAIIHDTENCCPRGANLKFHWTTNLLCVWPILVCHWLKVLDRLMRYSSCQRVSLPTFVPPKLQQKGLSTPWSVCPCYFWVFPECRYFCLCLSITKRDRRDGKKDARTSGKPAPPRPSFFKLTSLWAKAQFGLFYVFEVRWLCFFRKQKEGQN